MIKFFNNKKENIGITLVALVITIVILLILAGITISQLSNNGLFDKSKQAKEISENAQDEEETKIAEYNNEIDGYVSGDRADYNDLLERIEKLENVEYGDFRKTSDQSPGSNTVLSINQMKTGNMRLENNRVYLTEGKTYKMMCCFFISTGGGTHIRYRIYNKDGTPLSNEGLAINSAYSGYDSNYAAAIYTAKADDYIEVKTEFVQTVSTIEAASFSLIVNEIKD